MLRGRAVLIVSPSRWKYWWTSVPASRSFFVAASSQHVGPFMSVASSGPLQRHSAKCRLAPRWALSRVPKSGGPQGAAGGWMQGLSVAAAPNGGAAYSGGHIQLAAEATGLCVEDAVAKCVEELQPKLAGFKTVATVLLVNNLPEHEPNERRWDGLKQQLPPEMQTHLLATVCSPHKPATAKPRSVHMKKGTSSWACIRCLALEAEHVVEAFHAPSTSLPELKHYRRFLAGEHGDPTFLLLGQSAGAPPGRRQAQLIKRLEAVFPAGAKLCGVQRGDMLLAGAEEASKGTVGLVFDGAVDARAARAFAEGVLRGARFEEIVADPRTVSDLFIPRAPAAAAAAAPAGAEAGADAGAEARAILAAREGRAAAAAIGGEESYKDAKGALPVGETGASPWMYKPDGDERADAALEAGSALWGGSVPLFVLTYHEPLVPGRRFHFNIFEARYKAMVKAAVEAPDSAFVVAHPELDVGAACRVVKQVVQEVGSSVVEIEAIARVHLSNRRTLPGSFGLTVGDAAVIEDAPMDEVMQAEADALCLVALATFRRLMEMRLEAAEVDSMLGEPTRMSPGELSMWLTDRVKTDLTQRLAWLGMRSTVERLRDQVQLLRVVLAGATEQEAQEKTTRFGEEMVDVPAQGPEDRGAPRGRAGAREPEARDGDGMQ